MIPKVTIENLTKMVLDFDSDMIKIKRLCTYTNSISTLQKMQSRFLEFKEELEKAGLGDVIDFDLKG